MVAFEKQSVVRSILRQKGIMHEVRGIDPSRDASIGYVEPSVAIDATRVDARRRAPVKLADDLFVPVEQRAAAAALLGHAIGPLHLPEAWNDAGRIAEADLFQIAARMMDARQDLVPDWSGYRPSKIIHSSRRVLPQAQESKITATRSRKQVGAAAGRGVLRGDRSAAGRVLIKP